MLEDGPYYDLAAVCISRCRLRHSIGFMTPEVGQVINGKYRLVSLLGDGGMGTVWKAQHEKLHVSVALKFLHPELNDKQTLVDRFLQEARASAQIKSEYVVRTSDVDTTPDGHAFIVLEYLEGKTLQALYEEYHRGGQRLTYAEALSFAMQMLNGLEAAHDAGVVHRDLKPDNVMITKNSRGESVLKLLDFGIAKLKIAGEIERGLTRPGVIMGTPEYMAPEQAYSADGVDGRADVFSLGVIVFEMLAGRRPAGGDEPRALAQSYLTGQTAKLDEFVPNIAPELAAAVHKAMSGLAKDRFKTARAFREAIEPYATAARPPSVSNRPPAVGPASGSDPVMPPVALSTAGGRLEAASETAAAQTTRDAKGGAKPASAGVAKTWPPDGDEDDGKPRPDATRAMSPLDEPRGAGTVASGDMTAMMQPGGDPYAVGGVGGPSAAAASAAATPAKGGAKRKKKGMSLGAVLDIGVGVAAVVAASVLLVMKGPASQRDDDDRAARNAGPQPASATGTTQPGAAQPGADQPAIVVPAQPAQPPPGQPPQAQPPPPVQPPPAQPGARGPRAPRGPTAPSGAPTAPTAPGIPGAPTLPGVPGAPTFPPGMPNIPGLPTAPGAPPTAPSSGPAPNPPPAAPGIPGMPPMPSTFPGMPGIPTAPPG
jgi:serine/threonine protein kinase